MEIVATVCAACASIAGRLPRRAHGDGSEGASGRDPRPDGMDAPEPESPYGDAYRMLLIAFLELDGEEPFKRVASAAGVKG